jgi:hypothetical protein
MEKAIPESWAGRRKLRLSRKCPVSQYVCGSQFQHWVISTSLIPILSVMNFSGWSFAAMTQSSSVDRSVMPHPRG